MASGYLDLTTVPVAWFDETEQAVGWFDDDLLSAAAGGPTVAFTFIGAWGACDGASRAVAMTFVD